MEEVVQGVCDRGREKLDLEFTRKSETKPIAGEGKNKERRDAERKRKEETRQGCKGEGERKEEETRREEREREEEVKERDGETERASREAGWESNHTFESRPLPARE